MIFINVCCLVVLILLQYYIICSSDQGYLCWSKKILGDCICYGEDEKICSAQTVDQKCIDRIAILKSVKYNIVELTSSFLKINSIHNIKCDKLLMNRLKLSENVYTFFIEALSNVIQNILYIEESPEQILESVFETGSPNVAQLHIINDDGPPLDKLSFDNLPNLEVFKLNTIGTPTFKPKVFSNLRHLKSVEIHAGMWLKLPVNSLVFQSENLLHVNFSGTPIELEELKNSNLSNILGGLVANLDETSIENFPQDVFERFFKKNSNIELNLDDNSIICSYAENMWIFNYKARKNENFPVKNVKCANYGSKNLLLMEKCEFNDYDRIATDCIPRTKPSTHLTTKKVDTRTVNTLSTIPSSQSISTISLSQSTTSQNHINSNSAHSTTYKVPDKTNLNTQITTSSNTTPKSRLSLSSTVTSSKSIISFTSSTNPTIAVNQTNVDRVNLIQNYLIFIILGVIVLLLVILRLYFYITKYLNRKNNHDTIERARDSSSNIANPVYNTSSSYLTQDQINPTDNYSRVRKYLKILQSNETFENNRPQIDSNQHIYFIEGQTDSREEHIYETINYNTVYETNL